MPGRVEEKVCVVTGGAAGIGRAVAGRLAREGGRVAVADIDAEGAERTARAIMDQGGAARAIQVDVADAAAVGRFVDEALGAFGTIDVLVNNAGVASWNAVHETSDEEWHRVLGINLHGTFHCSRAAVPHMLERGGAIVNVCSVLATLAEPGRAAYCASKGGVRALTVSMARDLGPAIRVNCVSPGVVETTAVSEILAKSPDGERLRDEMTAANRILRRMASPEEIGRVVLFLASEDASFITGQEVLPDGGMTVVMR
jgi:NAD(P)-dependent dehydrogenase (short-subunit alcohol dehydrogenase family)